MKHLIHLKPITGITILVSFAVLAGMIACSRSMYMPTSSNTTSGSDLALLKSGRTTFMAKCKKCHPLIAPEKLDAEKWTYWVGKMAPKAKLTDAEKQAVLAYVTKGAKYPGS